MSSSFLRVFQNILHALEAAAAIAKPIAQAVDPTIGNLMTQAAQTAVVVEAAAEATGAKIPGEQKAAIVAQATQASIDLTNSLLASQGKQALPTGIAAAVGASTKLVVDTLNSTANTVSPVAAAAAPGA